ncbi:MAG TPA: hypothetical protein VFJ70_16785 [Burkholderiales bacterium]|nr:hypothetical protein [Burkholderiales bacterium]
MKRFTTGVMVLLAAMLVSCGGGGGGAGDSGSGGAAASGSGGTGDSASGSAASRASAGMHVEESDPAVTLSGEWTQSNPGFGWSGGSARQSTMAGARASLAFTGTSVTWFGSRGKGMGIALLSVDGGPGVEVDLFANPDDEIHSPAFTVNGLSDGPHTLTIDVTGRANHDATSNVVVVDAFDVQGQIVSHLQQTNPEVTFSGDWMEAYGGPWSGGGISNPPETPQGAKMANTAGAKATLAFRGTSVSWIGYRGPDAGIALVQIDGDAAVEVDTFSPSPTTGKVQEVLFTATGLADTNHTLTIEATGRRNDQSTSAMIFVDAFDVRTPGRRYQEWEPSIAYTGTWTPRNVNRVWSEGATATSNSGGSRAVFSFTGTSVSWISSAKSSLGTANVYLDGVFQRQVVLFRPFPIEAYQWEAFRADGLANGPHTLTIEYASGGYVVVDAFDVHP